MAKYLIVNQSNDLVMAQYSMPLLAKRLFSMGIARLNPKGNELISKFKLGELVQILDSSDPNIYARLRQAAIDLSNVTIDFTSDGKKVTCWALAQFVFDPKTKEVTLAFAPILKPHLLDLQKNYTNYLLRNIVTLTNPNFIRLFEILRSKVFLKTWQIEIDEFFAILQLPKSYRNFANLDKKFLAPARKAINEQTGLTFDLKFQKKGKKVIALIFDNLTYTENGLLAEVPVEPIPEPRAKEQKPDSVEEVYRYYMLTFKKDERYKLTRDRRSVIASRLAEGYTIEECKKAIDYIKASPFHNGDNPGKKIYIDLVDIIFNKSKFSKIMDNVRIKEVEAPKKEVKPFDSCAARISTLFDIAYRSNKYKTLDKSEILAKIEEEHADELAELRNNIQK